MDDLKILLKMTKMVYVIKDTVDIYRFCKNSYETAQVQLRFKLPPVSLKQIRAGGYSIVRHTAGLARRSEPKTPKYLSKNGIMKKKMPKSYP